MISKSYDQFIINNIYKFYSLFYLFNYMFWIFLLEIIINNLFKELLFVIFILITNFS